jgi:prolyl oligopeptidase
MTVSNTFGRQGDGCGPSARVCSIGSSTTHHADGVNRMEQSVFMFHPMMARWLRAMRYALLLACVGVVSAGPVIGRSDSPTFPAWLDEVEGTRALTWINEQNERTLGQLLQDPRYRPYYEAALDVQLDQRGVDQAVSRMYRGWVFQVWQDQTHPLGQWRRTSLESYLSKGPEWEVLLDLDALAREWNTRVNLLFDAGQCFGDRCMLWFDTAGGDGTLASYREFDLRTRSFVRDGFVLSPSRLQFASWKDADTLLVTRDWGPGTLAPSGFPIVVKEWKRGTALTAAKEIFRGGTDDGLVGATSAGEGAERRTLVYANNADGYSYYLLDGRGGKQRVTLPAFPGSPSIWRGNWLFLVMQDWKIGGRVWPAGTWVSIPDAEITRPVPTIRALFSPEPGEGQVQVSLTRQGPLVTSLQRAHGSRLWRLVATKDGWTRERIPMPERGLLQVTISDPSTDAAAVKYEDPLQPTTLYSVNAGTRSAIAARMLPDQFRSGRYLLERLEAMSKDGTKVPYIVVRSKSFVADGRAPTLLRGHGSESNVMIPTYDGVMGRLWLERGGVYALATIRGGTEFGLDTSWHVKGTKRQHTYEDFIAVADDLVRRRITAPKRLAIRGHSNGGALVGVALNWRPELFGAAVIENPVLDMVTEGERSSAEFGSWSDPRDRVFLERTSPLQNLRKQSPFPTPLITTSTTDERVPPVFARRYAMRLGSLGMPYLYYEPREGGHGYGLTPEQRATHDAIVYTYLARELMCERPRKPASSGKPADQQGALDFAC